MRKPTLRTIGTVLLTLLVSANPVGAQVATALIREGDDVPGQGSVASISNPAVNRSGGFSVTINTLNGFDTLSHVWGNASGGPGALLITEGTLAGYEQNSFEAFHGLDEGGIPAYSATMTETASGATGLDSIWVGVTPVLVEEQPVASLPGRYSVFNSRPGMTATGQPYWVGGVSETQGGATENYVLFYGMGASPVLMGGDPVVGVPEPVSTASGGIDFNVRYSAFGSYYAMEVAVDSGSTADDGVVVVNGAAYTIDGDPVREAWPLPLVAGGLAGEHWDNFDFFGVTESGLVLVTGDSDASTIEDEFVLLGGQIVLREGTVIPAPVGDVTLDGSIEGAYLNAQGDWAVTWDADVAGENREVLIFDGDLVLMEGDPVDLDGDGTVEPDSLLVDFTGISTLVVGDRSPDDIVSIYFTADVDVEGTPTTGDDVEGLFRLDVDAPNRSPIALCRDVTVTAGVTCEAHASVDAGSHDPDGDPIDVEEVPPSPYGLGVTVVTLTVTDDEDASDSCVGLVTVVPAPLVLAVGHDALSWGPPVCDAGFDVVRGDLHALVGTGGDFAVATEECLIDDLAALSLEYSGQPDPGQGSWFLARRVNADGGGTYDTGLPSQQGGRDDGIEDSGVGCP